MRTLVLAAGWLSLIVLVLPVASETPPALGPERPRARGGFVIARRTPPRCARPGASWLSKFAKIVALRGSDDFASSVTPSR